MIDSRVVEMMFDNKQFEKDANQSIETLKKLDNSLQMENGVNGLANVAKAAGSVSFDAMTAGIEQVHSKFSALEVMAITAISNITNSMLNMAKNAANALFIEPITSGMQEYEQKMDMVQTTVINSGRSLEEVNATLDELNHYADKTIFKFSDMTGALSKFTMSGITDLNLASTMIEGIGNIAGESGLKTEQASSAFYMISQAISAGKMSLYQWRTLENTGFASMKFKTNLLETAEALGKIEKVSEGVYKTYTESGKEVEITAETLRNTLTESGWMDSEVMQTIFARYASPEATEALAQATGKAFDDISEGAYHAAQDVKTFSQMWDTLKEAAQSGWTDSWETIIGDYEEAKKLWTGVNNVISGMLDAQSEQRNNMLKEWKELGGRDSALAGVKNIWRGLSSAVEAYKEGLDKAGMSSFFMNSEKLVAVTKSFLELSRKLVPSEKTLYKIKFIAEDIGIIINNISIIFNDIGAMIKKAFREIFPKSQVNILNYVWKATKALRSELVGLKLLIENNLAFQNLFKLAKGFFAVLDIGVELVKALWKNFMPLVTSLFPKASSSIGDLAGNFGDLLVSIRDYIKENDVFNKVFGTIATVISTVIKVMKTLVNFITTTFSPVFVALGDMFDEIFGKKLSKNTGFFEKTGTVLTTIFEALGKAIEKLAPLGKKILDFFGHVIGSVIDNITKFIDACSENGGFGKAITGLAAGFGTLLGLQTGWKIFDGIGDTLSAFKGVWENFKSMIDVMGGLEELKDQVNFNLLSKSFRNLAVSVAILAASFILLSMSDLEKVGIGFGIITATMGELLGMITILNKSTKGMDFLGFGKQSPLQQVATAMVAVASAVLILAIAMKVMDSCDPQRMFDSMFAITIMLTELTIIGKTLGKNEGDFKKLAKSLIKISVAILIMGFALKTISKLDPHGVLMGVTAISALLLAMGIFSQIIPKDAGKNMKKMGMQMILIATSMLIFAKAIEQFGNMDPNVFWDGFTAMGVILTSIAVFGALMKSHTKAIVYAGVAMMAVAASMVIFGAAIALIGNMDTKTIVAGTAVIVGLIAGLTLASRLVKPVKLIAMAGALVIFAAGVTLLAVALKFMSKIGIADIITNLVIVAAALAGFALLATILSPMLPVMYGLAGVLVLVSAGIALLGIGVVALSAGLVALNGALVATGGGLVVFITEILSLIPILFEMLGAGLISLITVLTESGAVLVEFFVTVGASALDALITLVPKFIEFLDVLLVSLLQFIIDVTPKIVEAILTLVETTVIGVCDLIVTLTPTLLETLGTVIIDIVTFIGDFFAEYAPVFAETVIKILKTVFTLVWNTVKKITAKVKELMTSIVSAIKGFKDKMVDAGKQLINGLVEGFKAKMQAAIDSVKAVGQKIVNAAKSVFGVHSPSRVFHEIGEYLDMGLANGIRDGEGNVVRRADALGENTIDTFRSTMKRIGDIISSDDKYNPTIRPVMDLSEIRSGQKTLSSILNNQNGVNLTASIATRLSAISGRVATVPSNNAPTVVNNNYDMTQNNYSPKALSRIDIYRQTANQFDNLKGVVNV